MKGRGLLTGALLAGGLLLFWQLTPAPPAPSFAPPGETCELTLLFTTDIHGYALPEEVRRGLLGGFVALEAEVRAQREQATSPVFLLDGGDVLTGQPTSMLSHEGVRGGYLFAAMNVIGFDAMALGNHEFDYGLETLVALRESSAFPWLAANFLPIAAIEERVPVAASTVLERDGVRLGVIGLTADRLNELVGRELKESFRIADANPAVRAEVLRLRGKVDVLVALTHRSLEENLSLAEAVPELDVILCGHSHRRIMPPQEHNGVLIAQAGHNLSALGKLELAVVDGEVVRSDGALISLWAEEREGSAEITALMDLAACELEEEMSTVLGSLESALTRNYYGESALGNFVAQAMRREAGTDVGLVNSGGLRTDLRAGAVTRGDIFKLMPFDNALVKIDLTGAELRAICRHNAWSSAVQDHGILQVSGLSYRWALDDDGEVEIVELKVGGIPVEDGRTYSVATNDFILFSQPLKYLGSAPQGGVPCGLSLREVVLGAFEAEGPTSHVLDGSIVELRPQPVE